MWKYLQSLRGISPAVKFYLLSEMLFGLGIGMGVVFNFHYLDLGLSAETIGAATAIQAVVLALLSYPAGMFTDSFGAKSAMLIGSFFVVCGYVGLGLTETMWSLYLSQGVLGLGMAFIIACEFPYIMSLCEREEDETTAYNLLIAAFTFTMALGNILGTKLPEWWPGGTTIYQTAIFGVALCFFLMMILRLFLPAKSERVAAREQKRVKKRGVRIIPSRAVVLYVIYATLTGIVFQLVVPFENVMLRERAGLSDDLVGYVVAANSFLLFLSSLFTPYLMKSRHHRTALYAAWGVHLLSMLVLGLTAPAFLFVLFIWGKGMSSTVVNASIDSSMMKATSEEERGLHAGMRQLFRSGAGALAVWFSGYLVHRGDLYTPYWIAFLVVLLQLAYYVLFVRRQLEDDLQEQAA